MGEVLRGDIGELNHLDRLFPHEAPECLAQLRLVCLAMGGLPIPVSLPISAVDAALDEAGHPLDPRLEGRLAAFLDEMIWYTRALAAPGRRAP